MVIVYGSPGKQILMLTDKNIFSPGVPRTGRAGVDNNKPVAAVSAALPSPALPLVPSPGPVPGGGCLGGAEKKKKRIFLEVNLDFIEYKINIRIINK